MSHAVRTPHAGRVLRCLPMFTFPPNPPIQSMILGVENSHYIVFFGSLEALPTLVSTLRLGLKNMFDLGRGPSQNPKP